MIFSNKKKDMNKLRFTQTGGFRDNNDPSEQSYSLISKQRITQNDLKILQLEREVESLKDNKRDLAHIQLELKNKENSIKKLILENSLEEKEQKLMREKTLQELAFLKSKVTSSKKRLEELDICYDANLIDFEELNRICVDKEKALIYSNNQINNLNNNIKEINLKSNNAGKSQLQLEEEKKLMVQKIQTIDHQLDEKLQEFKTIKEKNKNLENELLELEQEKNNYEKEGKTIENNIEDYLQKVEDLENLNEEKRNELSKLIEKIQKVEMSNFSLKKNLEMKMKNFNKQEIRLEEINTGNEKMIEKINNLELEKNNKENEMKELEKYIEEKNRLLEKQNNEKILLKKKVFEFKKLSENTFFELEKFVNLDEKIISMIQEGNYENGISTNEIKQVFSKYNQTYSNDDKSYLTQ